MNVLFLAIFHPCLGFFPWFRMRVAAVVATLFVLLSFCGCMSMGGGTAKVIRELAKDPATVDIEVQHPYGYFKLHRAWPGTNGYTLSAPIQGKVILNP